MSSYAPQFLARVLRVTPREDMPVPRPRVATDGPQPNKALAMADARARHLAKVAANVDAEIQRVAATYSQVPATAGDDVATMAVTKRRAPTFPRTELEDELAARVPSDLAGVPIKAASRSVVLRSKSEVREYLRHLSTQLQVFQGAAAVSRRDFERLLGEQEEALRKQWERAVV